MTSPLLISPPALPDEGEDDEKLVCNCGHHFERERLDIRNRVKIYELDVDLDEFDVDEHVVTRSECPVCSCCCEENEEICRDESGEEESQWMCRACLGIYDSESEALDCCQ